MKKKLFVVLFTFIALVLVTGCGSKNNDRVNIMDNLIGTWEYELSTNSDVIKGVKSTYTFDNNYKFTFKNVTIMKNGSEMTLKDLTGTYELDMDNKKINLTFDSKEDSDGLIKELSYKYENGKFSLNPDKDGDDTYKKK